MQPSDAQALIFATVATLIDQSLPEIQAVVLSVLLEATTAPHGKNFLETKVQDALHRTVSRIGAHDKIDAIHMRALVVTSISALILSHADFPDLPSHHANPSEN